MKKVAAQQSGDEVALGKLKLEYPELFSGKFLMDFLKNELDRAKKDLSDEVEFKIHLFQYH